MQREPGEKHDVGTTWEKLGTDIVNGLTNGLAWINAQLKYWHGVVVQSIASAAGDPWRFLGIILTGLFIQIILGLVADNIKLLKPLESFARLLDTSGRLVRSIASFVRLDLIFLSLSLADTLVSKFHEALAGLYKEIGELSETISGSVSFILGFAEVNRALLHAAYDFLPNGFLKAEQAYAEGLLLWLSNLKDRLGKYTENPSSIFLDMAIEISKNYARDNNEEIKNLWAGLSLATTWIVEKGASLITTVTDIQKAVDGMPQEIQEAIKPWYEPLKAQFDDFKKNYWEPFKSQYDAAIDQIEETLNAQGKSIKEIQDTLKSPADFLLLIGLMSEEERDDQLVKMAAVQKAISWKWDEIDNPKLKESATEIVNILSASTEKLPLPVDSETYVEDEEALAPNPPSAPSDWFLGEGGEYPYSPGAMTADKKTWFVGE